MPLYEITNKKSGRVSTVDQAGWDSIIKKGWKGKFNFKMVATTTKQPPFLPKEVIDMRAEKQKEQKISNDSDKSNEKK